MTLALVLGLVLGAPTNADMKDEAVERVEDVEIAEVEVVDEEVTARDASGDSALGRLHPAVVHFPLGFLLLLFTLELCALVRPGIGETTPLVLVLTLVSFVPGIVTGLLRFDDLESAYAAETLADALAHRNLVFASVAALLVALVLRVVLRRRFVGAARYVYLAVVAASLGLSLLGGHEGGELVWGDDFFPF